MSELEDTVQTAHASNPPPIADGAAASTPSAAADAVDVTEAAGQPASGPGEAEGTSELDGRVPDGDPVPHDEIEQRDLDSAPESEQAATLETLMAALASLDGGMAELAGVEDRLAESQRLLTRQSELADKLHAENQRLRGGELRGAMLPLVRDLLRLHDDIGRIAGEAEPVEDLKLMQTSLLDALARNGIVAVRPPVGEQFDPKYHSAAGVIKAEDASLDRSIAEVIRLGFQWEDGPVIRVAEVRVYKHTPANGSSGSGSETGPDGEASPDAATSTDQT
jgi:molecular chaperone GrpE (heat shock protein)